MHHLHVLKEFEILFRASCGFARHILVMVLRQRKGKVEFMVMRLMRSVRMQKPLVVVLTGKVLVLFVVQRICAGAAGPSWLAGDQGCAEKISGEICRSQGQAEAGS